MASTSGKYGIALTCCWIDASTVVVLSCGNLILNVQWS